MELKDALKQLKRAGTAHAAGPAYAAMCAQMVSWHAGLDKPNGTGATTKALYAHFCGLEDDKAVRTAMNYLMQHPLEACDVAFA